MHNTPSAPAWGWRAIGAALALIIAGTAVLVIGLRFVLTLAGVRPTPGLASPAFYVAGAGFCGLLILGVYLFAARRAGWAALGLRPAPWWSLTVTPPLVFLGLSLVALVNIGIGRLQGGSFENPQMDAITGGQALDLATLIRLLLLVAVLVPLAEELLFRGMVYPVLRHRWGAAVAVVASALLFAVCHFIPILIPSLFVIGVLLALLREWSGSLLPCIFFHGLQNAIVLTLASKSEAFALALFPA